MKKSNYILLGLLTVGSFSQTQAQEEESPLSASIFGGVEYDSNINVESIDSTTNQGDHAYVVDGSIDYEFVDNDESSFSAGYNFYNTSHDEVSNFDLQIHGFNASGRYTVGGADLGIMYLFNNIKLGGDNFLDMQTFRPTVGYLVSNQLYLTLGGDYQKFDFKRVDLEGRNSNRKGGSIKALFLLGDGKTINSGYRYSKNDADDDAFDYTSHNIDLSLKMPFDLLNRELTFRTGYRYSKRNYTEESLIYGDEIRSDSRHRIAASVEIPLFKGLSTELEYEYTSSKSTLESINYDQNVMTLMIGWTF